MRCEGHMRRCFTTSLIFNYVSSEAMGIMQIFHSEKSSLIYESYEKTKNFITVLQVGIQSIF